MIRRFRDFVYLTLIRFGCHLTRLGSYRPTTHQIEEVRQAERRYRIAQLLQAYQLRENPKVERELREIRSYQDFWSQEAQRLGDRISHAALSRSTREYDELVDQLLTVNERYHYDCTLRIAILRKVTQDRLDSYAVSLFNNPLI